MKVTFCGHKEMSEREAVEQWLNAACSDLISQGADEFYLGGYGGFDHLCAAVLRQLKKDHPHIRLILVLPYLNSSMPTDGYDETIYPSLESIPKRFAILRRNEWMIRESDTVVAYVTHSWGGAAKTLEYACRRKKQIILYCNISAILRMGTTSITELLTRLAIRRIRKRTSARHRKKTANRT